MQEMLNAMSAQEAIQPRLLALEQQYTPLYQQLQEKGIGGGIETMGRLYGQANAISGGLQRDFLGMQAPIYGMLGQASQDAYRQTLGSGTMGLYDSLMQSAQADLSAGRGLTPEMQRASQQAAREAMSARGLTGNQAVAQEVLNSYQMADARQNRAREFAGRVYDAGVGQAQQAMSMYGQPLMSQMAGISSAGLVQGGSGLYGSMGPQIFQPESQYNAQLITANRQEEMQARMATSQARAGMMSGLMKMGGAIIGGMATGGTGFFAKAATGAGAGTVSAGSGMGAGIISGNDMAY
jgi:hypothetical protein